MKNNFKVWVNYVINLHDDVCFVLGRIHLPTSSTWKFFKVLKKSPTFSTISTSSRSNTNTTSSFSTI